MNMDIVAAMNALLSEEQNRYEPHPDTCRLLIELWIDPRAMGAPLVMGRRMAEACIKRGMHPSDIVVMERMPAFDFAPDHEISVLRRKGKGERKSGRASRWNGRAV